ncbi:MAG TPA: Nramp family divalent metal transporter [Gemmatimonadaceae bacterium]|nr:Nramp family divalent metal transporter [Gemmatimonadaceae bacterium]
MRLPRIGPGAIVTAAFIGPGTVTTCTLAGARFGHALLWALVFATVGTIVLQEMAARLGVVGRAGLAEALRRRFTEQPALRLLAMILVTGAIGVGNAAYQTGNLLGASLGMQVIAGADLRPWALAIALTAAALLWTGRYRIIERALIAMVVVMSAAFILTAVSVAGGASGAAIVRGAFVPTIPDGAAMIALGLVGTTIVPYNLFLHASAVRERWSGAEGLRAARADLIVAIGLGGLVSMAIVITAAARQGMPVASAADMALQLEPLLGRWATGVFALGLLAAGVTSSITAPLAAAYALSGAFGWDADLRAPRVRAIWVSVIAVGLAFALAGVRPVPAILFAQAANGILLPAVAIFLLVVMNDRRALGSAANGWKANIAGGAIVGLTVLLGARALWGALG